MKKIIIVLMFIICKPVFAGFGVKAEIGNMLPWGTTQYYENISQYKQMYSDVCLFYDFSYGLQHRIYSGFRCLWIRGNNNINSPYREIYTTGYKGQYGNVYIRLEHFCNHAVYSGAKYWESNMWGEQMTTISIGVEFK